MTVREAAEARGIETFDSALPQGWVDEIRERFGLDVRGHFVWSYDYGGGCAAPITEGGDDIEMFLVRRGYHAMRYSEIAERLPRRS